MIVIETGIKGNVNVLDRLDKVINIGMKDGAELVAIAMMLNAREIVEQKSKTHNPRSGPLKDAIGYKVFDYGIKGYTRADLVVDLRISPYAYWIEWGFNAPTGLPYSKTNKGFLGTGLFKDPKYDFSKKSYKGQSYLRSTLRKFKRNDPTIKLVAVCIGKSILRMGKK